mmetsp:Transcript_23430/g.23665  ORF Transcript_23430/g.23665 Transcript_23430/m.23665 type:complete len:215 (+) Transcript_23430:536-1180(+)
MKKKENTDGQLDAQLSILSYICWMGNLSVSCSAFQRTGLDEFFEGIDQNYDNENDGISDVITVDASVNSGMEDVGLTLETIIETMDVNELRNVLQTTQITNGFISTKDLKCDTHHQPTIVGGASFTKIECVDIDGMLTKSMLGFFHIDDMTRPILLSPTDIELINFDFLVSVHIIHTMPCILHDGSVNKINTKYDDFLYIYLSIYLYMYRSRRW